MTPDAAPVALDAPRLPASSAEAPARPQGDAPATTRPSPPSATTTPATAAGVLDAWVWATCPHLTPDGKCRRERGGCRLLASPVGGCRWAEHGPILAGPEPVYGAYVAAVPRVWWRGRKPRPAGPIGSSVSVALGPRLQRARLCHSCGKVELAPKRRLCQTCRAAARRATWRGEKQRQRQGA